MGLIYLDACMLIYAMEDSGARGDTVRRAMAGATGSLATSAMAIPECLVGPLREKNRELESRYLEMFERLEHIELSADMFVRAAELRADFGIRTPDAVHLAAAQLTGCEQLWTNDRRLAAASHGLAVDILSS
ncbi:type II toxin-antitoxin system VapC family toxin [uncultured Microbacterium sp.]|uniref:type II toxin-antitoxin system VapC family toxin n=1 Tax=uncultured Microbacterium sp. TaxID=191216 RepID=UPI00262FC7AE|nr:type II toxin-antitoxin system VapC family toxin [uncultured Microbacterium sp.]